jgi:urea transporter
MARKPTRTNLSILGQLCNLIPAFLVQKIARQWGVAKQARTFSLWSHLVALLYAQFTHAPSLNDVCDALKNHAAKVAR